MQKMTYINVHKKVEHQQAVIDALRKENVSLRAKLQNRNIELHARLENKINKLKHIKITLRKLAAGL